MVVHLRQSQPAVTVLIAATPRRVAKPELRGTVGRLGGGSVGLAVTRVRAGLAGGLFEMGDAPVGGRELVFEADDASGRSHRHVLIEQRAGPARQREIGPVVAALAARGATRTQQPRGIRAAQKGGLHTEQLRGRTTAVEDAVGATVMSRPIAWASWLAQGQADPHRRRAAPRSGSGAAACLRSGGSGRRVGMRALRAVNATAAVTITAPLSGPTTAGTATESLSSMAP